MYAEMVYLNKSYLSCGKMLPAFLKLIIRINKKKECFTSCSLQRIFKIFEMPNFKDAINMEIQIIKETLCTRA